ncbi:MAG: glycosyltransferase 87 family protein [Crocinitomicaceae bacterium]
MDEIQLKPAIKISITVLMTTLIFSIGGFTPRTAFTSFITQYLAVFLVFILVMKSEFSLKHIISLGILSRLILIFFTPELSNDFYRFIWDGELLLQGINPYDFKPNELISYGQFLSNDYFLSLYHGMGELSQSNYSCYPVLNQFIFAASTIFSDNVLVNTAVMKCIIILADIGTLWISIKILKLLNLPVKKIGWYFLNPLIILEFSGNLHFEGVMIFFLMCFAHFTIKNNWLMAGIFLGFAVQIKLIPLMFIPFVYKHLKWKGTIGFTAVTLLIVLLLSQLLLGSNNIDNFMASLQLYFDKFQFNASLFNWANAVHSEKIGWDTTAIVGPILSKISLLLIILLVLLKSFRKPTDLFIGLIFCLTIYYLFATTIHPWYISLILIFSIFTNYTFGILWTAIITASYLAYADPNFTENKVLNSILYIVLFGFILFEIFKHWRKDTVGIQLNEFFSIKTKNH